MHQVRMDNFWRAGSNVGVPISARSTFERLHGRDLFAQQINAWVRMAYSPVPDNQCAISRAIPSTSRQSWSPSFDFTDHAQSSPRLR